MTAHTLSTTVTDTMAATDTDTVVVNSTAVAANRTVRRTFLENRIQWGSAIDSTITGPVFSDNPAPYSDYTGGWACPPTPITVAMQFTVEIPVRFIGCRIYKSPNATATSVPVKLWSGVTTGTELATESIGPWVVDDGGWQQVDFSPTVDLVPGVTYSIGYFSETGIYAMSPWVWHAQDTVVWPLYNRCLAEASGLRTLGTAYYANSAATTITFPSQHFATNYYIDPQVEWDDPLPGYSGGLDYHDQWVTPHTRHAFPVAVFFADAPYIADYYDMGVNTLMGGSPIPGVAGDAEAYIDEMNAMGNTMDWWPGLGSSSAAALVQFMTEEPDIAEQIVGYLLHDEPDLTGTFELPATLRGWVNGMRQRDSTRPFYMTMGAISVRNQGFFGAPSGGSMLLLNEYWRQWGSLVDVIACDDYRLSGHDSTGRFGVWTYAAQVGRIREITDDAKPVWITVETTSPTPDLPEPDEVYKAIWAALIAGARGIVLFDHRFPSDFVTQDFNAIHANAPMKAMMTDLAALLQTLGPALLAEDLGLVTAYTSSNVADGPIGGTYGVPLHYTTRTDGTYEYLFVQAIRPGATTGTITIPTWASEVVDVLDEARTETVSVGGVITDSFAADYQVHLYRRTL